MDYVLSERDIVNDYCSKCGIFGRELDHKEVALIGVCEECHGYLKRGMERVDITLKYRK